MVAGALIQIVSIGAQDIYLTGNPEISYFKTVYRRYTNFSMETIEEVFLNGESFGKQSKAILPRIGDLISGITLYIKLGSLNKDFYEIINRNANIEHQPKNKIDEYGNININSDCLCFKCLEQQYKEKLMYGWVNSIGHAIINSVSIEIGGLRIDKQYGEWFEIWTELTLPIDKRAGYYQMIGKVEPASFTATTFTGEMELYVPLHFWFCRNIGLSLPIMGLFYHNVELYVDFRKFNSLWVSNVKNVESPIIPRFEAKILIDYVFLDVNERRQFYQQSHMYLIEQLQCTGDCPVTGSVANIDLHFNHPVKELFWILQRNDVIDPPDGLWNNSYYPKGNDLFNYSTLQVQDKVNMFKEDTFSFAKLQFNGMDRFRIKPASYFRLYQPYYNHTRIPENNYIYVYPFGIYPENIKPSGTQNFSRLDNAKLLLFTKTNKSYSDYVTRVYGLNYNILVITSGMGGLLFQN